MSIFSSCFRAGVKTTQTKFASSAHNARPKTHEANQPNTPASLRAPLPPGFDATRASTFASPERLKQMNQGSQFGAFVDDLSVGSTQSRQSSLARESSLDGSTLSASNQTKSSVDTWSFSKPPEKTVRFAQQVEVIAADRPSYQVDLKDDTHNATKRLLTEADKRRQALQKQRLLEFQKMLERSSARYVNRP
jgi:hypothetical protein